jgi:hypothetical protein
VPGSGSKPPLSSVSHEVSSGATEPDRLLRRCVSRSSSCVPQPRHPCSPVLYTNSARVCVAQRVNRPISATGACEVQSNTSSNGRIRSKLPGSFHHRIPRPRWSLVEICGVAERTPEPRVGTSSPSPVCACFIRPPAVQTGGSVNKHHPFGPRKRALFRTIEARRACL